MLPSSVKRYVDFFLRVSLNNHNAATSTLMTELSSRSHGCLQVRVGNTTYYIGQLELAQSSDRLFTSLPFTISVAAASGVLLTVILVICVAYRHKTRQSQRIVRRMQTQMDALEARVANECKEGLGAYYVAF